MILFILWGVFIFTIFATAYVVLTTRLSQNESKIVREIVNEFPLGQYVAQELIAIGGFARLLRGRDAQGKPVALKVLRSQHMNRQEVLRQFTEEGKLLKEASQVYNAHIKPQLVSNNLHIPFPLFVDAGIDVKTHRPYLVMQYFDARNLHELQQTNYSFSQNDIYVIFRDCLLALSALHYAKYCHLDISPVNLLGIERNGKLAQVIVVDFGAALKIGQQLMSRQINRKYAAPEWLERSEFSPSADLYSLGIVLKELVIGNRSQHPTADMQKLEEQLGYPMSTLITDMIQENPIHRPQDATSAFQRLQVAASRYDILTAKSAQ